MSVLTPDVENPTELPFLEATEPVAPPFVNLLPPEVAERRALRRLLAFLVAAIVLAIVLAGVLVYLAGSGKADAQAQLSAQQSETTRLQQQVQSLGGARQAQAQLQVAQAALRSAMANEVLWSQYLDRMRGVLPDGVRLSNLSIAPVGAAAAAAGTPATGSSTPSSSTTAPAGGTSGTGVSANAVATVTITGKAISQDAVADWIDALGNVKSFTNAYLTSTTPDTSTGLITFTVTVDVTPDALSHRFDKTGS